MLALYTLGFVRGFIFYILYFIYTFSIWLGRVEICLLSFYFLLSID